MMLMEMHEIRNDGRLVKVVLERVDRESAIPSTSLLGCPFCGGEARYGENSDEGLEWIECRKCGACTTAMAPLMQGVKELLAEAWNQRQPNIRYQSDLHDIGKEET